MPKTDGVSAVCQYVIDCAGLKYVASTTNNEIRAIVIDLLEQGVIGVPTQVWNEFESAYEDEAGALKAHIEKKIRYKIDHEIRVAALAEKANSGYKITPYGDSNWWAAGVADVESAILISDSSTQKFYKKLGLAGVVTPADLLALDL